MEGNSLNTYNLDNNNHSVFKLYYHLIMCVKHRRRVIDNKISDRLQEIFSYIAPNYNVTLVEWGHDKDHAHVLFKAHPKTELTKFINCYKSASSRIIKKEFPVIKNRLWKEHFWSRSFCLLTSGDAPVEIVQKYIRSQGGEDE